MEAAEPSFSPTANKYEILGVPRQASQEDIKLAFRRLAMLYHPDRHSEADRPAAEEVFKRISSAYRTLSDEGERKRYNYALDRGVTFRETAAEGAPVDLADILAEINAYEHIFAEDKLAPLDVSLRDIVVAKLIDQLGEQVVGVWRLAAAPAGSQHPGNFVAGAVVLTNLRVLLPFRYEWQETNGNVRTHYRGAAMPAFPLPAVKKFTIESQGRAGNKIWVEIHHSQGSTRFSPRQRNLGKLLLVARLWGIAVEASHTDTRGAELRSAWLIPCKWALRAIAAALAAAAFIGIWYGGILDNPVDLALFLARTGLWAWLVVAFAGLVAWRIWRVLAAYGGPDLAQALEPSEGTAPGKSLGAQSAAV
jgi:DnaJ-domain-containing protein 1